MFRWLIGLSLVPVITVLRSVGKKNKKKACETG